MNGKGRSRSPLPRKIVEPIENRFWSHAASRARSKRPEAVLKISDLQAPGSGWQSAQLATPKEIDPSEAIPALHEDAVTAIILSTRSSLGAQVWGN